MRDTPTLPPGFRNWVLRRVDQAVVALGVLLALVGMAVYWIAHGGVSGRLVEIDRAGPLAAQFQVDLNAAEWAELIALPEIGPALAERIVEDRTSKGPFASIEELDRVSGIGPKTLERLRPYLQPIRSRPVLADRAEQ